MESSKRSAKSYHDLLPSSKPSHLSLSLVFICTILLLRNESTNDRLLALEKQMKVLSTRRVFATESDLDGNSEGISAADKTPLNRVSKQQATSLVARNRRQASRNTSKAVTIDDVRSEITLHFEELMNTKDYNSTKQLCLVGPPGMPGAKGAKGSRGRRGKKGIKGAKGKRGIQGDAGLPGTPGPIGLTGPTGTKGVKGDRGEQGPKGMPGLLGNPGESASAPKAMLSPTTQTKDEGGSASFFCSAGGNPPPKIQWRIEGREALPGSKYSVKEDGTLIIKRLSYRDAGTYTCIATNILGSHSICGNLVVQGLPVFTLVPPVLVTPKELSTLRQSCQADGIPPPVLSWRRSGMSFPAGKAVQSRGNLTISPICPVDSGLYECIATNSMGTKKAPMNVVVQQQPGKGFDCSWRSRYMYRNKYDQSWRWQHYSAAFGTISFQTSGKVFLQGYRLWRVQYKPMSGLQVTIRLYRGSSMISEKNYGSYSYGRYSHKPGEEAFEVYFTQGISLQAGILYTATVEMTGRTYYQERPALKSAACFGTDVTVTFQKSLLQSTHKSYVSSGIAALILRPPSCSN